jgi:hypothetical protein
MHRRRTKITNKLEKSQNPNPATLRAKTVGDKKMESESNSEFFAAIAADPDSWLI